MDEHAFTEKVVKGLHEYDRLHLPGEAFEGKMPLEKIVECLTHRHRHRVNEVAAGEQASAHRRRQTGWHREQTRCGRSPDRMQGWHFLLQERRQPQDPRHP